MKTSFDSNEIRILEKVQVNIPFSWLMDPDADWLELFVQNRIQPEIGLDAKSLDSYGPKDFLHAARRFAEAGSRITLHGPFMDLSPGSPDPQILAVTRKRLDQALAAAKIFSPKTMVCHAGYDPTRYGFIQEEWYLCAAKTWNVYGKALADIGVGLMLENVYEPRPQYLVQLFEKLDPKAIGCCLDVGHLHAFGNIAFSEWIKELGPYIGQLHLHDNHGHEDEHLGMGMGSIDFSPLHKWLLSQKSKPVITLEPHQKENLSDSLLFLDRNNWL